MLLLDAAVMEEGGDPLLGLQYCGEGKVRCIIPLSPQKGITKSLQVRTINICIAGNIGRNAQNRYWKNIGRFKFGGSV